MPRCRVLNFPVVGFRPRSISRALTRAIALACLTLAPVGPAHAVTGEVFTCSGQKPVDIASARGTLEKTQKAYSSLNSLSASFSQDSFSLALEESRLSTGRMWFLKPGRMKWHYKDPDEQIFTVKENTVWLYQVAEKQVIIDEFSQMLITDLPLAFMMGLGNLTEEFSVKNACNTDDGILLELEPKKNEGKGDQGSLSGFKLLVDPKLNLPRGASVIDVGGNITSIIFGEIKTGLPLGETDFRTEFPKGTDINDQRPKSG